MKKTGIILACLMLLVAPMVIGSAKAEENVIVYSEYLTDSTGYDYGANFYVDSNVNAPVYVDPYIQSRENVNGDVVYGVLLLQPNEKRVRIGSFISRDRSKAWSVSVAAKWKRAD